LKKKETARKEKNHGQSGQYRWAFQVFIMAVVLSGALSLASQSVLSGAGVAVALLILAAFILLGIVFDVIGVAVTAADPKPFHSMASHKEKGAKEALLLLRNASSVSSVCNDVVGDICGIVSGTTGAVIVAQLQQALNVRAVLLSVAVTALISGLTIGGKALGKSFAMRKSTQVVYWVGRFLHLFHR
jgi:CBS domain containing-hemolysin-like protein